AIVSRLACRQVAAHPSSCCSSLLLSLSLQRILEPRGRILLLPPGVLLGEPPRPYPPDAPAPPPELGPDLVHPGQGRQVFVTGVRQGHSVSRLGGLFLGGLADLDDLLDVRLALRIAGVVESGAS